MSESADPPDLVDRWLEPKDLKRAETEASPDFGKTQPLAQPTTEDILEIFARFQEAIFARLDRRDENMLLAIKDIGATMVEHYERMTPRIDDHDKAIRKLRTRTHEHATNLQAVELKHVELELRIAELERKVGI
jgi:hypothetical protein